MKNNELYASVSKYITLAASVGWLLFWMVQNELPTDVGDGIMHFFYAEAAFEKPEFFLHHWGKPFFILLAAPFAQVGFNGVVVFNCCVFALTVFTGYKILDKLGVNPWIQLLFPLLILLPIDTSITILGGLTEPLFNLALVVSLYLLLQKRYFWFALLVSFLPFMRSEGQLPVVLALLLLLYNQSYKNLPVLFSGFVLYGIIGVFVYHDFWWYFTKSPYQMDNGIYGKGNWTDYVFAYDQYLGKAALLVVGVGLLRLLFLLVKKKWREAQLELAFFAFGTFFGVLFLHSYFWATGQNGSLGLTRIATQGMPITVLVSLYYAANFHIVSPKFTRLISWGLALVCIYLLSTQKRYPIQSNGMERQLIAAANFLKPYAKSSSTLYYHFPLFAFQFGSNPFLNDQKCQFYAGSNLEKDLRTRFKPGDLLIRDSHFGPREAKLKLDKLRKFPELVLVKAYISSEQVPDKYNEVEGVFIYQYIPLSLQKPVITRDLDLFTTRELVVSKQEFIDIQTLFPPFKSDTKVSFSVETSCESLRLVYDNLEKGEYSAMPLIPNKKLHTTFDFPKVGQTKIYIWNPTLKNGVVTLRKAKAEEVRYPKILFYR